MRLIRILGLIGAGLGVIAAMAIHVVATNRHSRLMQSVADIRTVGTAAEAYATDHNAYPNVKTIGELAAALEPKYIKSLPRVDAWGTAFFYEAACDPRCSAYYVASGGKNGSLERPLSDYEKRIIWTTDPDADIVLTNGALIRAPESLPDASR